MADNPRRWLILGLGLSAQAAACTFVYGLPFLVPYVRAAEGLSLAEVGVLVSAPTVGAATTTPTAASDRCSAARMFGTRKGRP